MSDGPYFDGCHCDGCGHYISSVSPRCHYCGAPNPSCHNMDITDLMQRDSAAREQNKETLKLGLAMLTPGGLVIYGLSKLFGKKRS